MQHLSTEALARLVDETPTYDERAHLEGCRACTAELEAIREQTAALAELPLLAPPERSWPVLRMRLGQEGLLRTPEPAAGGGRGWLRAAAAVGIFLAGGLGGAAVGGATAGGSTVAAGAPPVAAAPRTPEAAAEALRDAESAYLAALDRYQELRGVSATADPAARLAALEGIVLTTRAALEAAPADPVINGYYLTAVGQRDAVLRQIALPAEDPWF